MKKILYIAALIFGGIFASCSDELETSPTDKVSEEIMLETSEGGQAIMNGLYRAMYVAEWGDAWNAENSGIMAYIQAGDLMGEDQIMKDAGQGWFYFDYAFGISSDWTVAYGRQGQTWKFFYTLISNANIVIAKENVWEKTPYTKAVIAQAYTMRAFAYYYLIQFFQQAYVEGADKPGVPIYTKPTTRETTGEGRGTIEDVYKLMNTDIDKAVTYFKEAQFPTDATVTAWTREHESNIDYYVANGIKARIALAQGKDYARVRDAAVEALSKDGLEVASVPDFLGWNRKGSKNVLWGIEVITSQSEHFNGFFSHMDADVEGMYAGKARRLIATGLYKLIPDTDERKKQWWRGAIAEDDEEAGNSNTSYCQLKFRFANPKTRTGDYLIMRAEEMLLMAAEAECRLGGAGYTKARTYLAQLGEKRDSKYAERLAKMTDAATYSFNTLDAPKTLLEEVLLQRRVELWGEFPRGFDLKRLKLGYNRSYSGSNHTEKVSKAAAAIEFVYPIPQIEFDGNEKLNLATDQNPM